VVARRPRRFPTARPANSPIPSALNPAASDRRRGGSHPPRVPRNGLDRDFPAMPRTERSARGISPTGLAEAARLRVRGSASLCDLRAFAVQILPV
jgi:hypothetical protein